MTNTFDLDEQPADDLIDQPLVAIVQDEGVVIFGERALAIALTAEAALTSARVIETAARSVLDRRVLQNA